MNRITKLLVTAVTLVLLSAGVAYADPNLSVRLEQPKSPTNQSDFSITFVALDAQGNSVNVSCYKKGPTDGSYSQFDTTKTLSNGGGTDTCHVISSIVNQEGTYSFYVIANDGTTSVTSSIVTVDYDTSGPGTPTNYSKSAPDSCHYIISFRTADDGGKTNSVEIYRSSTTTLVAGASSRVTTISIGSNTDRTYTDAIPTCGNTYYYAIRAFDSAGNASGLVGDGELTATTTTTNPTTTTGTNGTTGVLGTGAIPVTSGEVTPGAGENLSGTPAPTSGEKGVLGAEKSPTPSFGQSVKNFFSSPLNWTILIGIVAAVLIALWFFRRKNR